MKTTILLTKKQAAVLDFIRAYIRKSGRPPTVREICEHFGYASTRGGVVHLAALRRKGLIQHAPGLSRGITLTEPLDGIPVVGEVAAGTPILAIENVTGSLDLGRAFGDGELFAVRVKGDSMRDAGILNEDFVVVRRAPDIRNGAIGVAYLNGEATVKRIYKTRHGYRLQPENKSYEPIEITSPRDEDDPPPDFRLAGAVVGVVRKVRQ